MFARMQLPYSAHTFFILCPFYSQFCLYNFTLLQIKGIYYSSPGCSALNKKKTKSKVWWTSKGWRVKALPFRPCILHTHSTVSAVATGSWRLPFTLAPAKVTLLLGSGLGQLTVLVGRYPDQCNKLCLEGSQKKRQKKDHTELRVGVWILREGVWGFSFLFFFLLFPPFLIFFLFVKTLKDLGKDLSHYENVILSHDTAVARQCS